MGKYRKKVKVVDDIIVEVEDSMVAMRLDRALARHFHGWSRSGIERLIDSDGVKLNGVVVEKGSKRLRVGDRISVDADIHEKLMKSREFAQSVENFTHTGDIGAVIPEDIPIDIVYEDDDVLVVDKPSGMVIHPAYANMSGTLVNAVAGYFKKKNIPLFRRVGLVNRLDKDVSGLVLFAKNEFFLGIISKQFSSEGIDMAAPEPPEKARKLYWAVVGPTDQKKLDVAGLKIEEEWVRVEGYMHRSRGDRKKQIFGYSSTTARGDEGRYALSYIRLLKSIEKAYYLIEIRIVTGRTHQIRAQMATLGLQIAGDVMYGGREDTGNGSIRLRCISLSFIPPRVYKEQNNMDSNNEENLDNSGSGRPLLKDISRISEIADTERVCVERRIVP